MGQVILIVNAIISLNSGKVEKCFKQSIYFLNAFKDGGASYLDCECKKSGNNQLNWWESGKMSGFKQSTYFVNAFK